jgi:hypothetical protein
MVSAVFCKFFGIFLCNIGPLSLVHDPIVLGLRTRVFGIKLLCTMHDLIIGVLLFVVLSC